MALSSSPWSFKFKCGYATMLTLDFITLLLLCTFLRSDAFQRHMHRLILIELLIVSLPRILVQLAYALKPN